MPLTVKENVQLKLNNLRGKVHCAQQCVEKLHDSLESLPLDIQCLMVLDNMILSVDEIMANFNEMHARLDESPQTEMKFSKGATSHFTSSQVSSKDSENADLVSRMNQLEEAMDEMRSTIHGGGDGEGSPHRGILSHLSVLENSFNEGTQKLISMEEKVRDIDSMKQKVKDISIFRNEMRAKTVKEDQQKEMDNISLNKRIQSLEVENVTLTEEFKEVKGKMKEAIIENDSYEQRLICVEDAVKSVKDQVKDFENIERFEELENKVQVVVSDTDACKKKLTSVEEDLKTLKTVTESKKDSEKESENKYLNERFEGLEKKVETTVSVTDSCKDRLTRVEDRLKSVEPVRDGDRDEEVQGLKLRVANLDSLTKTQILNRISALENQPTVAFKVWLEHDGPWRNGTVIRGVQSVDFNVGNAFQENHCRFLTPVDGIYCFVLYLGLEDCNESSVKFQKYDVTSNEWKDQVWVVSAQNGILDDENTDTCLVHLSEGEAVRARIHGDGNVFTSCIFCGWLVSPDVVNVGDGQT